MKKHVNVLAPVTLAFAASIAYAQAPSFPSLGT